ncbi:MAG TPA: class I SAM-dependent methyltransferase [Gammaproteobacteria bacterium]|nr:class I SAM-dependent methyltransferase [Gammaproteobacteria bacterium]
MTGFSADWLALREPADAAARSQDLVERLRGRGPRGRSWRIVDLGSGTGANLRYLAPRLGGPQDWLLVDDDTVLLEHAGAPAAHAGAGSVSARCARIDLAASLDAVPWPPRGLVTASALLDLVSAEWLEALCGRTRAAAADVLFALTYDGRMAFAPEEPDDDWVRGLVNAHQRRDKGFGPALGPTAASAAARLFETAGYEVETARSDWRLDERHRPLQRALLDGWRDAAAETAPNDTARLERWHGRRAAHVAAGVSRLVVGHVDLLGSLRGERARPAASAPEAQ